MKKQDRDQFAIAMAKLRVTFPINLTPEEEALRMEVYWEEMEGFSINLVEKAIMRALGENHFFPKPAELKAYAMEQMEEDWRSDRQDRWPQIEYQPKEQMISRERAIEIFREISKRLEEAKPSAVLEGERADEFEKSRVRAKQVAKRCLS